MKTLLFCGAFAFGFSAYGQNVTGTYVNAEGQKLVITNLQECCFDFEVTWGVDDEWLCLFESSGTAKFADVNSAYFGEDPEWADIEFTIDGDIISIMGGYDYLGSECSKFGDSQGDAYTQFQKNVKEDYARVTKYDYGAPEGLIRRIIKPPNSISRIRDEDIADLSKNFSQHSLSIDAIEVFQKHVIFRMLFKPNSKSTFKMINALMCVYKEGSRHLMSEVDDRYDCRSYPAKARVFVDDLTKESISLNEVYDISDVDEFRFSLRFDTEFLLYMSPIKLKVAFNDNETVWYGIRL